ncbi:MAG: hypothetical protein ACI8ZM_004765 [Crocinitomix sp.]
MSYDLNISSSNAQFNPIKWEDTLRVELKGFQFDHPTNWEEHEGYLPASWDDPINKGKKIESGFEFSIDINGTSLDARFSFNHEETENRLAWTAAGLLAYIYNGELFDPQSGETYNGPIAWYHSLIEAYEKDYEILTAALHSNDLDELEKALNSVVNVNIFGGGAQTILMYYCNGPHYLEYDVKSAVELMIKCGVNIDWQSKGAHSITALDNAIRIKRDDLVACLIDNNVNTLRLDFYDSTYLIQALLKYEGTTAEKNIIKLLLKNGADLDDTNQNEISPRILITELQLKIKNGSEAKEKDLLPLLNELNINFERADRDRQVENNNCFKCFWWDYFRDEGTDAEGAEANLKQATDLMKELSNSDASFLGVVTPSKKTVQFIYQEDRSLRLDIPDMENDGSYTKVVAMDECLQIIKDAFHEKDAMKIKGLKFESWI